MKRFVIFNFLFSAVFCDSILEKSPLKEIPSDLDYYFSRRTFVTLFTGFTIGGVMANTNIDQQIQDFYQREIRTKSTDKFLTFWKKMGQEEVTYTYGSIALFSIFAHNTELGSFSKNLFFNSTRAFVIGTIPLHITRTLTGGRRPVNSDRSSYWRPLTTPQGVSGHTYTGAILFITWAKMVEGAPYKTLLYGLSTLTGISRVNDECHYPSQILLGWLMAYVSCDAVNRTNSNFNLSATPERVSFGFEF